MRQGTKWLLAALLLVGAFVGWRAYWGRTERNKVASAEDPALLLNRVWVDSKPKKATDFLQALFVTDRLPLGIFQKASAFRVLLERFQYHRDGRTLRLTFPQTKRNDRISYQIRACDDLPPFDLCLELSRNPWEQGPTRYYSSRENRSNGPADLEKLQRELEVQVQPPGR